MLLLYDGSEWFTGYTRVVYGLYTSGSVFIGHEGVARVVYQNGSHECITRKPLAAIV